MVVRGRCTLFALATGENDCVASERGRQRVPAALPSAMARYYLITKVAVHKMQQNWASSGRVCNDCCHTVYTVTHIHCHTVYTVTPIHFHTVYTITPIHRHTVYIVYTPSANRIGTSGHGLPGSTWTATLLAHLVVACPGRHGQPYYWYILS